MKYRTQFDEHKRFISDSGCPEYSEYGLDKDGNPILVATRNRFDEIQSHRESVELATLLQRYAAGDETALNQKEPFYGDYVDAPSNLQEWFERYRDASKSFDALSPDIKNLFDNNAATFWTKFGTEEFSEILYNHSKSQSMQENNGSGVDNNVTT